MNTTESNARVWRLIQKIKASKHAKQIFEIVKRLQSLDAVNRRYSRTGEGVDINKAIADMDLPFDIHLFITGNYSDLMNIDFYNNATDAAIHKESEAQNV